MVIVDVGGCDVAQLTMTARPEIMSRRFMCAPQFDWPNALPFRRGPLLAVAWNGWFGPKAR
jgi:hypothetical protein